MLLIKQTIKHILIFKRVRRRAKGMMAWRELTCQQKMQFFNLWFFISTAANVFNIISCCLNIQMFLGRADDDATWDYPLAFTGLACAFFWFGLVQYLEHFPNYYGLILTLRMSAPRVLRFVLGVAPVFIGFAMFGVAFFSPHSDLFSNLDTASVTLFALLNGDVIHDVFQDIYPAGRIISRVYLYTFIMLFIYAVLNIFIAIVEDGFFAAKRLKKIQLAEDLAERSAAPEDLNVFTLLSGPPVPNNMSQHTGSPAAKRGPASSFNFYSQETLLQRSNTDRWGPLATPPQARPLRTHHLGGKQSGGGNSTKSTTSNGQVGPDRPSNNVLTGVSLPGESRANQKLAIFAWWCQEGNSPQ